MRSRTFFLLRALLNRLEYLHAWNRLGNLLLLFDNTKGPYETSTASATAASKSNRSFSLSRSKRINWKPSNGRGQENECYKRLIYKRFVQVSGLCGPQFPSYLPNRFMHLCRALMETPYWCAILAHQYGRRKSTKTSGVHFFYKSSFFSLKN